MSFETPIHCGVSCLFITGLNENHNYEDNWFYCRSFGCYTKLGVALHIHPHYCDSCLEKRILDSQSLESLLPSEPRRTSEDPPSPS